MTNTEKLKTIVDRREAVIVPGVPNALFARVVEDLGFDVVYVSSAGVTNMLLGMPDIGLISLPEVVQTVSAISDVIDLPIIVDADTGFGNELNMTRTVRLLERAGAAGIQIEDQVFPKKCGHFSGKGVIPCEEMISKIKAAVDSRVDGNLQIIARTDALAVEGIDQAIERAQRFIEAGADITFVEAPTCLDDLSRIARELQAPQLINIVFGGKTPALEREQLAEMNFSIVLYANAALQAALYSSYEVLGSLKKSGSLGHVSGKLVSFEERQRVVKKEMWDALESKYRAG